MVLIALFGTALPFALIAWGLRSVDSGLAGILMAVMPLATLSFSHFLARLHLRPTSRGGGPG
jgi:drug/metabolite transporter (DMT)-like permease